MAASISSDIPRDNVSTVGYRVFNRANATAICRATANCLTYSDSGAGIAINPRRQDLIECMKDVKLPFCTIEELRDKAYAMTGTPDPVQFEDRVVGIIEGRDGTIMDVVRQIKEFEF